MGRIARVVVPGAAHYLTQRGNHQQDVFFEDRDREMYLRILGDNCPRAGLRVPAYCLMSNHVHLVAVPAREDSLAKGLGLTNNEYARWLHVRERQSVRAWPDTPGSGPGRAPQRTCPARDGTNCWTSPGGGHGMMRKIGVRYWNLEWRRWNCGNACARPRGPAAPSARRSLLEDWKPNWDDPYAPGNAARSPLQNALKAG